MASQEERRNDPVRQGVGMRLKAAREGAGLSQKEVIDRLGLKPGSVSSWEKGIADPGIYRLRELAKLYGVASDAILWEDSLSPDAMKFAAEFDSLSDDAKKMLSTLWVAYIQKAVSDADVEKHMPVTNQRRKDETLDQVEPDRLRRPGHAGHRD